MWGCGQAYQDRLAQLFARGSDLDIKARTELASLVGAKVRSSSRPHVSHIGTFRILKDHKFPKCVLHFHDLVICDNMHGVSGALCEIDVKQMTSGDVSIVQQDGVWPEGVWFVGVQHEAERQAWTHMPQAIHKHYALQACLMPTNTTLNPPTMAGWQAILVRSLLLFCVHLVLLTFLVMAATCRWSRNVLT